MDGWDRLGGGSKYIRIPSIEMRKVLTRWGGGRGGGFPRHWEIIKRQHPKTGFDNCLF